MATRWRCPYRSAWRTSILGTVRSAGGNRSRSGGLWPRSRGALAGTDMTDPPGRRNSTSTRRVAQAAPLRYYFRLKALIQAVAAAGLPRQLASAGEFGGLRSGMVSNEAAMAED